MELFNNNLNNDNLEDAIRKLFKNKHIPNNPKVKILNMGLANFKKASKLSLFVVTLSLIVVFILVVQLPAIAETQTITAVGEYTMGEGETPSVAKERALEQAMHFAAEQAGAYIESYSKTNNFRLTKDEFNILARGIVEVIDKKYDEPKAVGDGFYYRVTINGMVNTDNIESLRQSLEDKARVDEMKKLQAAYDEVQKEIEQLKQQLKDASDDKKKIIEQSIAQNEKQFTITQWFERGYDLGNHNDYQASIQAFTEAINLNPKYADAYNKRGCEYYYLKQYDQAIDDLNKAISIDPQSTHAYSNRGAVYGVLKQYDQAIVDLTKAISIDPLYATAYYNRGCDYYCLKQYDQAIDDLNKAISIDPPFPKALLIRGTIYFKSKQYNQAIDDFSKLITINPQNAGVYYARGITYWYLKQYQMAITDFRLVIINTKDLNLIAKAEKNIEELGGTP